MSTEQKTQHTPEPWELEREATHSNSICTIHGCKGNTWLEVWKPHFIDEEQQEANARLIAAAPEMYSALMLAADCIGDESILEPIKAALAKADGEGER